MESGYDVLMEAIRRADEAGFVVVMDCDLEAPAVLKGHEIRLDANAGAKKCAAYMNEIVQERAKEGP